jgi:hypothetical protein
MRIDQKLQPEATTAETKRGRSIYQTHAAETLLGTP